MKKFLLIFLLLMTMTNVILSSCNEKSSRQEKNHLTAYEYSKKNILEIGNAKIDERGYMVEKTYDIDSNRFYRTIYDSPSVGFVVHTTFQNNHLVLEKIDEWTQESISSYVIMYDKAGKISRIQLSGDVLAFNINFDKTNQSIKIEKVEERADTFGVFGLSLNLTKNDSGQFDNVRKENKKIIYSYPD